ncbi:hypothetical protein PENSTE_c001G09103 [Penicillium steckii]|uniref:CENP-V/GFA domain-containing protein n=1 Tax=Penicillium steckii TaxID=303698 RepID=A0A1V6U1F8_9EURO|nr:hypothetical protein PENSTE_c001G09103 [Penicillium steckii]
MANSISCLCGNVTQQIQLDPSTNHSHLQLCHCSNCRSTTGLLSASYYLMQHEPATLDGLQIYKESPHVSRLFCRTCGAHTFARLELNGRYLVASGVLTASDTPHVESIQHWKIQDTIDGGLSEFLPGWPSTESCALQSFCEGTSSSASLNFNSKSDLNTQNTPLEQDSNLLRAECHCGGIQFYITSPDVSSFEAWSPWPDLLVPYHAGSADNPDNIKWWLRDGETKYLAGTCACTSCRLGSGFPIQTWAFIPKSNLLNADQSPLTFGRGTMRQYSSSSGVFREFCSCCGANVFWHNVERPTIVDVSVGLLRGDGARVEGWLEWATGRVSFTELAIQKDLIGMLEVGLQDHRKSPF